MHPGLNVPMAFRKKSLLIPPLLFSYNFVYCLSGPLAAKN